MSRGRAARRRRTARRATVRASQLSKNTDLVEVLERRKAAREERDFAVSGSTSLPLGPRDAKWDGPAADKAVRSWAGAEDAPNAKYASAFFLKRGDGSKFGDYGLGFAEPVNGKLQANWGGITAVAGVLSGARGGLKSVSASDISGIKSRVEGYYGDASKLYKDDSIKVPWSDDAAESESAAFLLARAQLGPDADEPLLAMATSLWEDEFASKPVCADCDHAYANHLGTSGPCTTDDCDCTSYSAPSSESAVVAAVGDVAWAPEDGFRDLLGDVNDALGGGYNGPPLRAVDAAIKLDKVLVCNQADDSYYVAPITVGDDNEPTLSDPSEWVPVEAGWVETPDDTAVINPGLGRMVLTEFAVAAPDAPIADSLPDAHKPGQRIPRRNPTPGTPATPEATATPSGPVAWSAILAPEGRLTSDRRAFAPGSITWPRLDDGPLTLMGMVETSEGGHLGAQVSGRIDQIWRDESAGLIRASGVFDEGEFGQEIARMVADQTLRGISVDLAISKYETGPMSDWFDEDGNWAPSDDAAAPSLIDLFSDDVIAVVLEAEIGMATVCPFQAFAEAQIAEGDSLVAGANPAFWTVSQQAGWTVEECETCGDAVVASAADPLIAEITASFAEALTAAAAGLVPETPPREWFEDPGLDGPTAITVDDDGRIYGHAASWGICHIGFPSVCKTAPHSKTDYSYFHLGEIVLDDGLRLPCGQITLDAPHADLRLDRAGATSHYDHTGTVVAHVRCGEDEHGIWVAGALQPDAPAEKVRLLRGSKLSGDWRDGELVALLAVNVPGFPVPRQRALAASGEDGVQVLALVAAGIPVFEAELSEEERERFAELAELAKAS